MSIESRLEGGFLIGKRPANDRIIVISIEIPPFNQLSALTGVFGEEINENHGLLKWRRCMFHNPALMSPGRYSV